MTLRDEVDKAVANRTPAELAELLQSRHLLTIARAPNDTDEQWRRRILDYYFNHAVESKRKRAIEQICQLVGVKTPEERKAELAERQLSALEATRWQRVFREWIKPILVAVLGTVIAIVLSDSHNFLGI